MPDSRRLYYESLIARGGGMINCGQHLGVMIGPAGCQVPKGWCFVPIDEATPELIGECCQEVALGRKNWPDNEAGEKPIHTKVRRIS